MQWEQIGPLPTYVLHITKHICNAYPLLDPFFLHRGMQVHEKHNKAICINHNMTRNICSASGVMIHVYP